MEEAKISLCEYRKRYPDIEDDDLEEIYQDIRNILEHLNQAERQMAKMLLNHGRVAMREAIDTLTTPPSPVEYPLKNIRE